LRNWGSYEASIEGIYKILVAKNELTESEYTSNVEEAFDYVIEDLEYRSKTNDILLRRKLIAQKETITLDSKEVINMAKQITIEDLWNK
jgi:frataxin-like iron-binding protein CyaY